MEAGLNFDRLAQAVDRGDHLRPPAAVLRAELWFWQRGLTWNYPELTRQQEKAWEEVWSALEAWLDEHVSVPENYRSDEITSFLHTLLLDGDADEEVGNENWGDGAARFDGEFEEAEMRSAGREGDASELNWIDREALLYCAGAILQWSPQGFRRSETFTTEQAFTRAWNEISTEFAPPAPTITMENSENDELNMVILTVYEEGAARWARNDQTIHGAHWEIHDGDDFAYATVMNEPDLAEQLRREGYNVDDSQWSPPEEGEG